MARLYSNENFPLPVVEELRRFGHDVLTVQEAGKADQSIPDEEVLEFAVSLARIVLTINRRDFVRLHRHSTAHAGIVICSTDADFTSQAHRIHQVLEANSALTGQLLRVNRPQR